MLSDEQKTAFTIAVDAAARARDRRSDALRRAVYHAVDLLKTQGWRPEHIILYLRQIAKDVPEAAKFPFVGDTLTEWCLARYYRGPDHSDDPPA